MPGTVKSELLPDADRSHKCDCQEKVSWKRNLPLDKSHFITEMHKCQKRLTTSPKSKSKKKKAAAKGNYKVGDVVNFHGGTHYLSSDSGSKGFTAKAGKAKITLKKPGKSHPYHLIHSDSSSNVYGWVDEGSFD